MDDGSLAKERPTWRNCMSDTPGQYFSLSVSVFMRPTSRVANTSSRYGGEDGDPGGSEEACVGYEDLMGNRVYSESMGSIVGTYLVQYPIDVGTVLLDHC